mgnify:CR=1 FL=1
MIARIVARHFYATSNTLADVYYYHTTMGSLIKKLVEPWLLRSITATIATHNDASKFWSIKHVANDAFLNAWEKAKHHNIRIHSIMRNHRLGEIRLQNVVWMECEVDASIAKVRRSPARPWRGCR